MGIQKDTVKFNVGGKIFETTATTLVNTGRNSYFGALFDENWNLQAYNSDEYFIDRNPNYFSVLLDFIRTGELCIPSHIPEKPLYREAMFYGLLDHVRSAKWVLFNRNRLRFSGRSPVKHLAMGLLYVPEHGSVVHVYDWMLQEHSPIILDYQRVNDVGLIHSEMVAGGGKATLFSGTTGS